METTHEIYVVGVSGRSNPHQVNLVRVRDAQQPNWPAGSHDRDQVTVTFNADRPNMRDRKSVV